MTTLWSGRHLEVREADGWEFATRPGITAVVAVVAVTDHAEIVLVEQQRRPVGGAVIELPAGLVGDVGEADTPLAAAKRELLEETGFEAADWTLVADGPSSAGLTDESPLIFLAGGLVRRGPGGGDEHEAITVHVVRLTGVQDFLREARARGLRIDPKVYVGLWLAGAAWDGVGFAGDDGDGDTAD